MNRLIWTTSLCVATSLAFMSCRREGPSEPSSRQTEVKDTSYPCRQVHAIDAASAWPIPPDAEETSGGVHTKRVVAGRGRTPKPGSGQVLLLCATYYDRKGAVVEHDPLIVHNIDLPPKEWQDVLSRMSESEVRRFWISPRRHIKEHVIGDFELQPFPEQAPAR
jgi:hypothetical protein